MTKIHEDLVKLRREIGGLVAKQKAAPYKTKDAADLMEKLRDGADVLNMTMAGACVAQEVVQLPTEKGTMCHVIGTFRFMSDDGSYVDFVGSGHGCDDRGDKAGGKASTYAWKDAVWKGLSLPNKEMIDTDDEMPEVVQKGFNPEPKKTFNFGKGRN
jgi:hypothetical protein